MKYANYSIFSTDFKEFGLDLAVKHTLEMGFNAVEHIENAMVDNAKLQSLSDALRMRKLLDANGLTVSCYSVVLNLLAEDVAVQKERMLRHVEYARELGSPFVHHTLVPGYDREKKTMTLSEVLERIADDAADIAKYCNVNGMMCLYEPQGLYFNGVDGVGAIIREMRSRGLKVGVCGDTGNSIYVDVDPVDIFRTFSRDIVHVHVKDYCYGRAEEARICSEGGKAISDSRFGEGDCHVKECLAQLSDYSGDISFEFKDTDSEMARSIEWVKELMRK